MNTKEHIQQLLQAYYDGVSTASEEKELRDYFASNNDVDDEFIADRNLLLSFDWLSLPAGLTDRMNETIDRLAAQEVRKKNMKRRLWIKIASSAAAIAIVAGLAFSALRPARQELNGTMTDEEIVQYTQMALGIFTRTIDAARNTTVNATYMISETAKNQSDIQ